MWQNICLGSLFWFFPTGRYGFYETGSAADGYMYLLKFFANKGLEPTSFSLDDSRFNLIILDIPRDGLLQFFRSRRR